MRPLGIPLEILLGDSGPTGLDRLDKVLEVDNGLEEFIGVNFFPGHLHCVRLAGGARGDSLLAIDRHLRGEF